MVVADEDPSSHLLGSLITHRIAVGPQQGLETCSECGGDVRIIASIEDPVVIQKVLAHLENTASRVSTALLPDCRASPNLPVGLFD